MANNDPPISWPLYRPVQRTPWSSDSHANGHAHTAAPLPAYPPAAPPSPRTILQTTLPMGPRTLAGIAMRAGLLGAAFSSSLIYAIYLLSQSSHFWRIPFFLAALSLFHFLEFWCTAQYNPLKADVASFLLSTNGWAYNTAHTCALLECLFWYTFFPNFRIPFWPESWHYPVLGLGLAMLVMGQAIRSAAMVIAGTNFNHTVQFTRKAGHDLASQLLRILLVGTGNADGTGEYFELPGVRGSAMDVLPSQDRTRRGVAGKVFWAGIRGLPSTDMDLDTIHDMASLWKA
ncbi:hypothetical protein MMC17_002513 [Xylographa soralifera]|nr:hypothetical protein [Xylographa soralifera]